MGTWTNRFPWRISICNPNHKQNRFQKLLETIPVHPVQQQLLNSVYSRSLDRREKTDAKLLKEALAKWHTRLDSDDEGSALAAASVRPTLPETSIGLDKMVPHPLCRGDMGANSVAPLARVPQIRTNRTTRTRPPSPAKHIDPGWEHTPGIPKVGFFLELFARVRIG